MALGYTQAPQDPFGLNLAPSLFYTGGMESFYGMPTTVGNFTKFCAIDYPTKMPYIVDIYGAPILGSTREFNTWTVPLAYENWSTTQYCAGATSLAAGAAIATVAFTMY